MGIEFILGGTWREFAIFSSLAIDESDDTEEKVLGDAVLDDDDPAGEDEDLVGPEEIEDDDTFMDTNGRVEWEE